jgi:hypothetical protein
VLPSKELVVATQAWKREARATTHMKCQLLQDLKQPLAVLGFATAPARLRYMEAMRVGNREG